MSSDGFSTAIDDRYFEDYAPGAVYRFGEASVSAEEIVDFGRRYDPQAIHVDTAAAAKSRFGGLIASGWQTSALTMRMLCEHYVSRNASVASPGVDELRWTLPVRPGDRLSLRVTVLEARRSVSKPDRGLVRSAVEVINQDGQVVMSMKAMNLLICRKAPAAS